MGFRFLTLQLIILAFSSMVFSLRAQSNFDSLLQSKNSDYFDNLPFNEKGDFLIQEVVETPGSKEQLFGRAALFYAESFNSANDVVQVKDSDNGLIQGKGLSELDIDTEYGIGTVYMFYSIKIECKDNRFRYRIYDVYYQSPENPNIKSTPQDWFRHSAYESLKPKHKKLSLSVTNSYVRNTRQVLIDLISMIKESMQKIDENDDW